MRNTRTLRAKTRYNKKDYTMLVWGIFIIACIALVLTIGWFVGKRLAWQSNQVMVRGSYIESLSSTLSTLHHRRFLGIIPVNNKVFFPERIIEKKLLVKYPRLISVDIDTKWKSIIYNFTEREPVLVVCTTLSAVLPHVESVYSDSLIDSCWYVDETGMVFDSAPRISSGVYPILIIPDAPTRLPLQIFDDPLRVATLRNFVEELKTFETDTEVIIYNDQDTRIISTHLFSSTLSKSGSILFDTHEVFDTPNHTELLKRIEIATTKGPFFEHLERYGAGDLRYLDMRFSDKFFYKFSPSALIVPSTP